MCCGGSLLRLRQPTSIDRKKWREKKGHRASEEEEDEKKENGTGTYAASAPTVGISSEKLCLFLCKTPEPQSLTRCAPRKCRRARKKPSSMSGVLRRVSCASSSTAYPGPIAYLPPQFLRANETGALAIPSSSSLLSGLSIHHFARITFTPCAGLLAVAASNLAGDVWDGEISFLHPRTGTSTLLRWAFRRVRLSFSRFHPAGQTNVQPPRNAGAVLDSVKTNCGVADIAWAGMKRGQTVALSFIVFRTEGLNPFSARGNLPLHLDQNRFLFSRSSCVRKPRWEQQQGCFVGAVACRTR